MILAALDVLVMFSGLPTGWKKGVILVVSLVFILIGWSLHVMSQRRKAKTHAAAHAIEVHEKLHEVAHEIAHDVAAEVEHDIQGLTETSHYESPE